MVNLSGKGQLTKKAGISTLPQDHQREENLYIR